MAIPVGRSYLTLALHGKHYCRRIKLTRMMYIFKSGSKECPN